MDKPPLLELVDNIKTSWQEDAVQREIDRPEVEPTTAEINRLAVQSAVECAS